MKKISIVFIVIIVVMTFAACKKNSTNVKQDNVNKENISDENKQQEDENEEDNFTEIIEFDEKQESADKKGDTEQSKTPANQEKPTTQQNPDKPSESTPTDEQKQHDHNYKLTKEVKKSCVEDGYKEYTCLCGDQYKTEDKATGHVWSDWKNVNEVKGGIRIISRRTCKTCNEVDEKTAIELPVVKLY